MANGIFLGNVTSILWLVTNGGLPPRIYATVPVICSDTAAFCCAVGGIMGFALVYEGAGGVTWAVRDPGAFPPYKVRR